MDVISENKKNAFNIIQRDYKDKDIIKFTEKTLEYLKEIDDVIFDEMLGKDAMKITKLLKKAG